MAESKTMKFLREQAERGKKNPEPIAWSTTIQGANEPAHPERNLQPRHYIRPHLPSRERFAGDSWDGRSGLHGRVQRHIERSEALGLVPRHLSYIVTPPGVSSRQFKKDYGLYPFNAQTRPHSTTGGIQEAIDESHSRIFIKDGTYPLASTISVPSLKTIEGETKDGTILQIKTGSTQSYVMQNANGGSGANGCHLQTLTLDAHDIGTAGGLYWQGAGSILPIRYGNLVMEWVDIINHVGAGLTMYDSGNYFHLIGCGVYSNYNTAAAGIHLDAPDIPHVHRCVRRL